MNEVTRAAFDRLLGHARSDTGQARRVASFVLAWWNADTFGGFDLADLFAVDAAIAQDMSRVFNYLATRSNGTYPDDRRPQIEEIIRRWHPQIWARSQA
ncbi:DUF7673 family protein [Bosea sp. 2RAB26]|uniref:DUF7673 family protein n=1 Tax=Bosea sp. 2RAB26 TaxID=3237476 RepID=UPI003F8DF667